MRIGWVLGWAVPEGWFGEFSRSALPAAEHHFFAANSKLGARLEAAAGRLDWLVGYSLGSHLLLASDGSAGEANVALLAPVFAFPREAAAGGRVARAQVRHLRRWVRREPVLALEDFRRRAGLGAVVAPEALEDLAELDWGLGRLEDGRIEPPMPAGWRGWCGSDDVLLDAAVLKALDPRITVVPGGTHHPGALVRAWARDVGLSRDRSDEGAGLAGDAESSVG